MPERFAEANCERSVRKIESFTMNVAEIWSYPVKSMVGVTIDSCDVTVLGIAGDRRFAVRDLVNGGIRGAKKIGPLMQLAARPTGGANPGGDYSGVIEITFPDGSIVRSDDASVHQRLSDFLGVPVHLEALPSADDLDHFRRGGGGNPDIIAELRSVFGREEDEPLPDLAQFPPEIVEFESPPGTYYDCWPLMVMSTSAIASLTRAVQSSIIDVRRFRPSLVVDTGDAVGHPEFSWSGRRARIGTAEIEFLGPCPRCVMVTRSVGTDIPEDRAILRHIVRDLDQNVGVYARVLTPGRIVCGDSLEWNQ